MPAPYYSNPAFILSLYNTFGAQYRGSGRISGACVEGMPCSVLCGRAPVRHLILLAKSVGQIHVASLSLPYLLR